MLINNAGVSTSYSLLTGSLDDVRLEMKTHYFGTLAVARAFVPVIEANGGQVDPQRAVGVVVGPYVPAFGAYSAAKAAGWAMTDALRQDLAPRSIHVAALHIGYMDTDMAAFVPTDQKVTPR